MEESQASGSQPDKVVAEDERSSKPEQAYNDEWNAASSQMLEDETLEATIQELRDISLSSSATELKRASALASLGHAYHTEYVRTGDRTNLDNWRQMILDLTETTLASRSDQSKFTQSLAEATLAVWEKTKDKEDLKTHMDFLEGALSKSLDGLDRARLLADLAKAQEQEYGVTKELEALERAIKSGQGCLILTPIDHSSRLDRLVMVARAHYKAFQMNPDAPEEVMELWIGYCQSALELMTETHPQRLEVLQILSQGYSYLSFETTNLEMLQKSLDMIEDILGVLPSDDSFHAQGLFRLGMGYGLKAEWTGETAHLETGTRHVAAAAELAPENHPDRVDCLRCAASMQHDLYEQTREMKSLESSVSFYEKALENLPDDNLEYGMVRIILTDLTLEKARREKAEEPLSQFSSEKAITSEESHPDFANLGEASREELVRIVFQVKNNPAYEDVPLTPWGSFLSTLTQDSDVDFITYYDEFLEDLSHGSWHNVVSGANERKVREGERILNKTPENSFQRQLLLLALGHNYVCLFYEDELLRHLDQAIHCFREGLQIKQHQDRVVKMLSEYLAWVLWIKSDASEDDQDLEVAIEEWQKIFKMPLAQGPLQATSLHAAGNSFKKRYYKTNAEADLDMWLLMYQRALAATPVGAPLRAVALLRAAEAIDQRYQRRGALEDLETSIQYLEEGSKLCSEDDRHRTEYLSRLAYAYLDRFLRTQGRRSFGLNTDSHADLVLAARTAAEALNVRTTRPGEIGMIHTLLGQIHLARFRHVTGDQADIDNASNSFRLAYNHMISWADESMRDHVLTNLGEGFFSRSPSTRISEGWETQEKLLRLSLESAEEKEQPLAGILYMLGRHYHRQYKETGDVDFLQKAIPLLERALSDTSSWPMQRISPSLLLLDIYAHLKDWPKALGTASTIVSLIPSAIPRSLQNSDKQKLAADLAGLGPKAVSVALLAGETPYTALKLLESSRGVILRSLVDLRSETTDLEMDHPDIAQEYLEVQNQMDITTMPVGDGFSYEQFSTVPQQRPGYRYDAAAKLEQMIKTIRQLPGYESFLRAPSEDAIKAAASGGPIVIVNVSEYSCYALIVETTGIQALSLHNVTYEDIEERGRTLTDVRSVTPELLEWLWDGIAEPVLDRLGFIQTGRQNEWPRIWWIPTGPLVRFPLHAAGYHTSGTSTVLDRAISSYSPSLAALIQRRAKSVKRQNPPQKPEQAVMVGMDELPYAKVETRRVMEICRTISASTPQARSKDILAALKACDIFHFAGHGSSNPSNPSQSSLHLTAGDKIMVSDLLDINLHRREPRPFLAFLSACRTGQVKDEKLADEGLHLMAACQVAGFRHVIGTLWEVKDEVCVNAAVMVYEWMQKHNMRDDSVSEGLHHASRELRKAWIENGEERKLEPNLTAGGESRDIVSAEGGPLLWVPYVHFGI